MNSTDDRKDYRILALDDHPMVTEGICHLLSDYAVTTANMTADALALLQQGRQFDMFILDLELPDADGFKVLTALRSHCPAAAILIYTMHEEPWILARLASLDIQGVVSKALPVVRLREAIETVSRGDTYFDEAFTQQLRQLMNGESKPTYLPGSPFTLSEREQQVLQCIVEGLSTTEISQRLFISENTVGTHRRHLMTKFDAHNVAQLISKARRFIDVP